MSISTDILESNNRSMQILNQHQGDVIIIDNLLGLLRSMESKQANLGNLRMRSERLFMERLRRVFVSN